MNYIELSVFIAYFVFMVAIGLYFFSKSKGAGEKDYFLGDPEEIRKMMEAVAKQGQKK